MTKIKKYFIIFLMLFINLNLFSQNQEEPLDENDLTVQSPNQRSLNQSSSGVANFGIMGFLQMFFIFALIILSIYGLFFLIKKASSNKIEEDGLINLIDNKNLGQNRYLHLVKIADELFFLSSTDSNINLISKIENQDTVEKVNLQISEIKSKNKTFKELIGDSSLQQKTDFLKGMKDKIKKM